MESAPLVYMYLKQCEPRLNQRESGRFRGAQWYQYGRPQNMHRFERGPKIIFGDVARRGECYLDTEEHWILDTSYAITLKPTAPFELKYLLGVLNSPILTYYLSETGTPLRGGYFRMKTGYLIDFPLPEVKQNIPADVARHDRMVDLVTRMLDLHKRLAAATLPHVKDQLQRQIDATDKQIDALVYELYELTDKEIAIVEGSAQ